jgi:hypothetical protein
MKLTYVLSLLILCFTSCKNETKEQPKKQELITSPTANAVLTEAETIAFKHGLENWKDVRQIDFTFNVDRGGKNVAQRSWSWKPKTGDVTMTQGDEKVQYNSATVDSTSMRADQGFINDKFWLLAPYQLVWDEGTTISVQDTATAPISKKLSKMLTIIYGNEGGYTPGDAYDFYYNEDFIIQEWVFRKGNSAAASMTTTFEGYQDFNGLQIATEHKDATGSFKLYFTDIKVIR